MRAQDLVEIESTTIARRAQFILSGGANTFLAQDSDFGLIWMLGGPQDDDISFLNGTLGRSVFINTTRGTDAVYLNPTGQNWNFPRPGSYSVLTGTGDDTLVYDEDSTGSIGTRSVPLNLNVQNGEDSIEILGDAVGMSGDRFIGAAGFDVVRICVDEGAEFIEVEQIVC